MTQILEENHVLISRKGVSVGTIVSRLAWLAELDLMTWRAGLTLTERWGGWHK